LTGERVFEKALNVLAIVSSINVTDSKLIDFEGEFCFPSGSIDMPAVEFSLVLLAAAAFKPLLDFWEWMVVQRSISGRKCHGILDLGFGIWDFAKLKMLASLSLIATNESDRDR
jgi:hypothetical protein